jgi:hypothetical protein
MFLGRGDFVLDKFQLFLKGMAFSAPDAIMMFWGSKVFKLCGFACVHSSEEY